MSQNSQSTGTPQSWRNIFGIIMILVYIGMGVLLFINFFDFTPKWAWARIVMGCVFCVYGVWRGWRQFAGVDYPNEKI